jgi:hypothetical protein
MWCQFLPSSSPPETHPDKIDNVICSLQAQPLEDPAVFSPQIFKPYNWFIIE